MSPKIHSSASQWAACMPEKNWVWHTNSNSLWRNKLEKKKKKKRSRKRKLTFCLLFQWSLPGWPSNLLIPFLFTGSLPKHPTKLNLILSNFYAQAFYFSLQYFMGYDELLTRTLHLSVWHKMIGRNCFLGEIKIPMNNFVEAGNSLEQPVAKWFNLTEKVRVYFSSPVKREPLHSLQHQFEPAVSLSRELHVPIWVMI